MKLKKYLIIIISALVIGLIGRFFINDSTLFVDTNTKVPKYYLPINDYILVNKDTKEPIQNIKTLNFKSYIDSYDYGYNLETTKGISCKSSFEDFIKAYGDYIVTYISCYNVTSNNYEDSIYLHNIKLSAFYNDYILSGKCNLDDYNIYINFTVYTRLNKVYYTQKEKDEASQNENIFWNVKLHEFTLAFSYFCKNVQYNEHDIGYFDYIISDKLWSNIYTI